MTETERALNMHDLALSAVRTMGKPRARELRGNRMQARTAHDPVLAKAALARRDLQRPGSYRRAMGRCRASDPLHSRRVGKHVDASGEGGRVISPSDRKRALQMYELAKALMKTKGDWT